MSCAAGLAISKEKLDGVGATSEGGAEAAVSSGAAIMMGSHADSEGCFTCKGHEQL